MRHRMRPGWSCDPSPLHSSYTGTWYPQPTRKKAVPDFTVYYSFDHRHERASRRSLCDAPIHIEDARQPVPVLRVHLHSRHYGRYTHRYSKNIKLHRS